MGSAVCAALESEGVDPAAEVSVLLTTDPMIQSLNARYRGIDQSTDVLSFCQHSHEDLRPFPGQPLLLGDIVISVDTAARQAVERSHSLQKELAVLAVHGALHLLGYDDATAAADRKMQARHKKAVRTRLKEGTRE